MSSNPIDQLLAYPTAARIAIWLWVRDPDRFFTAEEIADGIRVLSSSRIQQTVRLMSAERLLERQNRETNRPGPAPFEYRLAMPLVKALTERRR